MQFRKWLWCSLTGILLPSPDPALLAQLCQIHQQALLSQPSLQARWAERACCFTGRVCTCWSAQLSHRTQDPLAHRRCCLRCLTVRTLCGAPGTSQTPAILDSRNHLKIPNFGLALESPSRRSAYVALTSSIPVRGGLQMKLDNQFTLPSFFLSKEQDLNTSLCDKGGFYCCWLCRLLFWMTLSTEGASFFSWETLSSEICLLGVRNDFNSSHREMDDAERLLCSRLSLSSETW